MSLHELVKVLNNAANDFEIGRLQELRARLRSLGRRPSRGIFSARTTHGGYAFHLGGRKELQFNIGEETHGDLDVVRFGVAFSLQLSRALPRIDPLLPKVARFNEYVQAHPEEFPGLRMWHYDDRGRSADRPVGPIADELVVAGTFIFVGRWVTADAVSPPAILADFDRLLPLFVFVEGDSRTPEFNAERSFEPGCPRFVTKTVATRPERTVDVALRHQQLQLTLYEILCREAGHENVRVECPLSLGIRVDAVVRRDGRFSFYELKVAASVQSCVRAALGQLLEYAFWPSAERASELVVVGEAEIDADGVAYLRVLRERFALPLWYRRINVARGVLDNRC